MAFPLIIRICHWQKRLFVLCSFSPFSFRVIFFGKNARFLTVSKFLHFPFKALQSQGFSALTSLHFLPLPDSVEVL